MIIHLLEELVMYFRKMVGKKCYLSPMNEDDAVKFTEWLNDLNITSNLAFFHQNINIEKEKMLLNSISKEHHYSIIDNNSNDLIGSCGLQRIDHLNQTASIGIIIGNKNYWNKGYGTEALTLLIDYGFKALNLHNIFLSVFEFNERAIKCYEKVGFKEIGRRRKCLYRNLKRYDLIYMDILVNEFYENNKIIKEINNIK
jgi:RimJ/RimL family protein N-acetyltransferase